MNQPRIRPLAAEDLPRLFALMDGLADYERLPRPDAAARARLGRDALASPPRFHTLLADLDGATVAYAIYLFTYSSFLAQPTLYLEDIYVLPTARRQGVGQQLIRRLAEEAVAHGCGRMEWQVLRWNQPALDFYARAGALVKDEWIGCRLDAAGLARLAADR